MRIHSLLPWAMVAAVLGFSGTGTAQANREDTIQIGGGVYAVIDRIEMTGHPFGLAKQDGRPMPYTPAEMCLGAGPENTPAHDPFRLADRESAGLLAAIVKMRLVGPPVMGPQKYSGSVEVTLVNPCPQPIAVPVVWVDDLHDYLPKEGRFEAMQILLMFLAGGDGLDAELSGAYPLAGSPNNEKTYRILRQGEAVVLVLPVDFAAYTMSQREFEHLLERSLPSLRLIAWFGHSYWNGNGQISTHGNGWSIVCDHESVPVERMK